MTVPGAAAVPAAEVPAAACGLTCLFFHLPGSSSGMGRTIFIFDTTHHALWAEEIARERQIAHEIVPAPPGSHARCDIAIETLAEAVPALASGLGDAGVEFRLFGAPA